jgi:hypothetical protein
VGNKGFSKRQLNVIKNGVMNRIVNGVPFHLWTSAEQTYYIYEDVGGVTGSGSDLPSYERAPVAAATRELHKT